MAGISQIICEEEIRETFYNLMLEFAMNKDLSHALKHDKEYVIQSMICSSIKEICLTKTIKGFPTIRGNRINLSNVHPNLKDLFNALEVLSTYNKNSNEYSETLSKIVQMVRNKDSFKLIIDNVIRFYLELSQEKQNIITEETIQDTFYNLMVNEVLSDDQIITKDALESRDPYIYIAMSSQAIISCCLYCKNRSDIILQNNSNINQSNCPEKYKELFEQLLKIKTLIKAVRPNDNQIEIIRIFSSANPDMSINDDLEKEKNPNVMKIASIIQSLALKISTNAHFREIIDNVIQFCLDALS